MPNTHEFLNKHVLKPETVRAIEAMGEVESQIADRWAGGWPKQTRRLEAEGRLLQAVKEQAEADGRLWSTRQRIRGSGGSRAVSCSGST